jgi:hypothetical protein
VTVVGARATTGVVILGMHRSGTSAATRAVNLLGVPLCSQEDLWLGTRGNPSGYWESASLARFNDRLLREAGAAWWCPPRPNELETEWKSDALRTAAFALFARLHATTQWVWKDPRTCLTLPFWRDVLQTRFTCLLVLRNPLEIAESLRIRDSMPTRWGLALWERYSHHALRALDGQDVIVTEYADLVGDPLGWARRVSRRLAERGLMLEPAADVAAASLSPELRHVGYDDNALRTALEVTPEQRELYELMRSLDPDDEQFVVPALPTESGYVDELFLTLRRSQDLERLPRRDALQALLRNPATQKGNGMSTIETNHTAVDGAASPEWCRWAAENLLLGFTPTELADVMAAEGHPEETAHGLIDAVRADPCWQTGDEIAQRLRKLESLLDILRDLDRLDGAAHRLDRIAPPSRQEILDRY